MNIKILLTGASGNVGKEVVAALRKSGSDDRIRVTSQNRKGVKSCGSHLETVYLNFRDPESFHPAVSGCSSVFLLRPPAIADTKTTLNPFIDVARKSGVKRIVFLSVAGAADNRLVPHHAVEQQLRNGPKDWTILRPGFFAQNLASAYRDDIVRDGRIYVPAGNGKVAFVDLRDVGTIAAEILLSETSYWGGVYTLTGPASYSFHDVARLLSQNLARSVKYVPAGVAGYIYHLVRRRQLPLTQAIVQTILHVGLRFGQAEKVDPTLGKLLNRKPNSVETYIEDHVDLWRE